MKWDKPSPTLAHAHTSQHKWTQHTHTHTNTHTHTVWFQQPTSFLYGKKSIQTKDAVYLLCNTGALSRKHFAVQEQ